MTTEYRFEHVFRAPSVERVLHAYFEPEHLAAQDTVAELTDRAVVESNEDAATKACTWSVTSLKSLPFFARAFVSGGKLSYRETMVWRKASNEIDMTIVPQILGGRVNLHALYQLELIGAGQVRRRYGGSVTVDVRLVAGKVERGIVAEIERGMPLMVQCTQDWLDRNPA